MFSLEYMQLELIREGSGYYWNFFHDPRSAVVLYTASAIAPMLKEHPRALPGQRPVHKYRCNLLCRILVPIRQTANIMRSNVSSIVLLYGGSEIRIAPNSTPMEGNP
jgi:hypothetical protein